MSTTTPKHLLRLKYANAAEAYLRSLPPEHFMEAKPQAVQREITVESLALLRGHREDVQYFNEMLVQYMHGRPPKLRQVVPDNMVAVCEEPLDAVGSYDVELQPVRPFWVLEYVSKNSERKDYEDSFRKSERELKVPYYLLFYPDVQELTLYRHSGRKYVSVKPNENGRCALAELDLEMAILEGWVRYWYRGKLLQLPAALERELEEARREVKQARRQARQAEALARQAQEQLQQAQDQAKQAQDQARQAHEQAEHERQQKERLLAQLRELGLEPKL
jgi:hypothetical protein